jgi:hypothetical protein
VAYDPDERFSLYPMDGEDVLKRLLGAEDDAPEDSDGESLTEDVIEP